MKQLKWDPILVDPKQVAKANDVNGHTFDHARSRRLVIAGMFQETYYGMILDDKTRDYDELANDILNFGAAMSQYSKCPSLIEMDVPYGVRKQLYELHEVIADHIHHSLNSQDYHFNIWRRNPVTLATFRALPSKADLARTLWKWYYTALEPVAARFKLVGAEHTNYKSLK